ncbi:MAG: molybdopterin cofactor-binding domain-containing protein [Sphaerochaetaceae bacterium]
MAEKVQRPTGLKPGMLHGIIVRSTIDSGIVLKTTLPELDSRFLVITAKDIPGSQTIDVLGEPYRIFSTSTIEYRGQPMLAIFGPDAETVEVKAREIEVEYQLPGMDTSSLGRSEKQQPKVYESGWGNLHQLTTQAASYFERIYKDRRECTQEFMVKYARCSTVDTALRIEVPTQWPFHVVDSVAAACAKDPKDIVVQALPYYTTKDEHLVNSSVLASIAAIASLKSKRPVQLGSRYPTCKPSFFIQRKTALDAESRPIAEEIVATIECGATILFSDELANQMKAGLLPFYPLEACSIKIICNTSDAPPANFFGDLGYSAAVFSTEAHASALAKGSQSNPANWRIKYYEDNDKRSTIVETLPLSKLRDIIGEVCTISDFARHNAVYELQRRVRNPLSTFINYSRGVGIACASGISGFSASFPFLNRYSVSLKLDTNNRVMVHCGHLSPDHVTDLWRTIIKEELALEGGSIEIIRGDTSTILDSGPNVLMEDITHTCAMLQYCCSKIKKRRFQDPLPIIESCTVRDVIKTSEPLFSSGYWGTLVLELEVNTVTLQVDIRHIWCHLSFANAHDKEALKASCRQAIISAVLGCNARFTSEKGRESSLEIYIEDQNHTVAPSSAHQALKGMVMAALTSALSQALNNDVSSLPITGDDLVAYIREN